MTDGPSEDDIMYKPRTGDEMEAALDHKVPIHLYSDLAQLCERHTPIQVLANMFKRSNKHIILLQDPDKMESGHWISVSKNPRKKEMYFFSTYGGKPDVEKIKWISEEDRRRSNQLINVLNDGLEECQKHGWEIHYNDYPYQVEGDKSATCGIYTVAFLQSGKNPDEFREETLKIQDKGINPAVFYFKKYFK